MDDKPVCSLCSTNLTMIAYRHERSGEVICSTCYYNISSPHIFKCYRQFILDPKYWDIKKEEIDNGESN